MSSNRSNIIELRTPRARLAFESFIRHESPAAILEFNAAQNKYMEPDIQRRWDAWQAGIAYEKNVKKSRTRTW